MAETCPQFKELTSHDLLVDKIKDFMMLQMTKERSNSNLLIPSVCIATVSSYFTTHQHYL